MKKHQKFIEFQNLGSILLDSISPYQQIIYSAKKKISVRKLAE